jgi:hypothetical protein
MMGRLEARQAKLFYEFCLEDRVPADHLLRKIDAVLTSATCIGGLSRFTATPGAPPSILS